MRLSGGRVAAVKVKALGFAAKFLVQRSEVFGLGTILQLASILAIVIDNEVGKTEISFLTFNTADTWMRNVFSGHNSGKSPSSGLF